MDSLPTCHADLRPLGGFSQNLENIQAVYKGNFDFIFTEDGRIRLWGLHLLYVFLIPFLKTFKYNMKIILYGKNE